jgi:hypothetical protein
VIMSTWSIAATQLGVDGLPVSLFSNGEICLTRLTF